MARPQTFSKLGQRLIVRLALFLALSRPWPSELVFQGLCLRVTSPDMTGRPAWDPKLLHDQSVPWFVPVLGGMNTSLVSEGQASELDSSSLVSLFSA